LKKFEKKYFIFFEIIKIHCVDFSNIKGYFFDSEQEYPIKRTGVGQILKYKRFKIFIGTNYTGNKMSCQPFWMFLFSDKKYPGFRMSSLKIF